MTGSDLLALDILTNTEVIAVNQDKRGDMARIVDGPIVEPHSGEEGSYQVLSKVLHKPGQRAVGLLNRTEEPMEITVNFSDLRRDDGQPGGVDGVRRVRDLWAQEDIDPAQWEDGSYTVTVPGHGLILLKIWGQPTR